MPNGEVEIVSDLTEILDDQAATQGLEKRLKDPKGKLKKLNDEAEKRGYRPTKGKRGALGVRQRYRAAKPVEPEEGIQAAAVQDLEFELSVRALEKPDSKDQAAIATVRVTAGGNTQEYDMLLEAPAGDFQNALEFKVDENDKVVRANSWWTAVRSCLTKTCAFTCVSSLLTCGGTWVAYLGCVAAVCGGCWVKCAACSTCNCRWWCRWGAGCCSQ